MKEYKVAGIKFCFMITLLIVFISSVFGVQNVKADSTSTEWTPVLNKTLTGRALEDDMFDFTISSTNGGPLPANTTVSNAGENISFAPITFTSSDVGNTYIYRITENSNPVYESTPDSYEISVKVSRDGDNNIIATENILKNTNNPNANHLGGYTWSIGGWSLRSGGNGTGSIVSLNDTPTNEETVFRILNNTSGNKDWGQNQLPYKNGTEYTVSGYVRIPTDSTYNSAKALVRIWDGGQNKAIFSKTFTINKADGWVPYSYTYTFNGTETNSSYQVGLTGAGEIEMNGLRVESTQVNVPRTFANTYVGKKITVDKKTKGGFGNQNFTFKVKAWKTNGGTTTYADLSRQGLTSIGNNEYTFSLESNSEINRTIDIPTGFEYEIKEVQTPGWYVYSVDGDKSLSVASGTLSADKTHAFVNAQDPIDVNIKVVDNNGNYLPNAIMRVSEGADVQSQWRSENSSHTVSLSDGTYTLGEVSAPNGYYAGENIEFVVKNGKVYINDEEIADKTIVKINDAKPKYKFAKVDKDTGEFLKDAWMIINQNGMPVSSFHSTDGYYEVYLENGTYQFAEKIAPTGYKLANPISFTISNNTITSGGKTVTHKTYKNNTTGNVISKKEYDALDEEEKQNYTEQSETFTAVVMEDSLAKGDLKLTKKDAADSTLLPKAKYRFWGQTYDGKTVEREFTTNENGEYTIEDLPLGTYHYQEIEAPSGYELDNTIYDVNFNASDSSLDEGSSTVTNKDACETYNSGENYSYYDYDNGEYSTTKSYYEKKLDGGLYIGGNAKSSLQENNPPHTDLDSDPNDFAKILPYGNVFINKSKINFNNASLIFPEGSPFHLVKKGDAEIGVDGTKISDDIYTGRANDNGMIIYLGSLKSYIKGVGAPGAYGTSEFGQLTEEGYAALINNGDTETTNAEHNDDSVVEYGNTKVSYYKTGEHAGQNVITNDVDGYVYQIVYYDAAILPDGSIGNLVFTINEMTMESATDKLENVPYVVQENANNLNSGVQAEFNNGGRETMRWPQYVFSPSASNKNTDSANGTFKMRNAIGNSKTFTIQVVDKNNNPVDGIISYSAKDLDLASAENVWGRKSGSTEYSEGMEIVSGSKSFAVIPKYDHVSNTGTLYDGYVFGHDMAINAERRFNGENADGIRFSSFTYHNLRDESGKKIGGSSNNSNGYTTIKDESAYSSRAGKRYATQRADNGTFDTGFAVLLDSRGSTLKWTGSSTVNDLRSVGTTLFDSSVYVRLQQAHGTGGDLYIEAYDYTDNCSMSPIRRDVSMGMGDSNTLAIVPDDGWDIEKITIDGTTVMFKDLTFNDGVATYDFNGTTYTFTKDSTNPKKVRVSFDDVHENHSISADYVPVIEETRTNAKAYGDLIVNKTDKDTNEVMSGVSFTLSGTSDLGESVNITKDTGGSGQAKFEHVPAGSYTLHEATPNRYKPVADKTVVIARDSSSKVVTLDITNEKLKYDVTLKKKVTGNLAEVDRDFDYKITVYDNDEPISGKLTIEKNGTSSEIDNGSTIKLKHNETAVIKNLIMDYEYSIVETDTEYTESYKIDKTAGGVIIPTTSGNTITKQNVRENQTVTYTNYKSDSVITGIFLKSKHFILLGLLSIIGLYTLYIINKRLKYN